MTTWAETPFALIRDTGISSRSDIPHGHPALAMAKSMALTHNVILRSINASYNQCHSIKPRTAAAQDFLYFNQSLTEVLDIHHDVEEEFLFPAVQQLTNDPHIMDTNLREHQEFHEGLAKFKKYIYHTSSNNYDGQTMQTLLEEFGTAVQKHLHHEIPTLIDLHKYDGAEITRMSEKLTQLTMARSNKFKHFPLFLGCADRTFVLDGQTESFPKIPSFVFYLAKYVFEPAHAGAWKFNPCTTFGQPRAKQFDAETLPGQSQDMWP